MEEEQYGRRALNKHLIWRVTTPNKQQPYRHGSEKQVTKNGGQKARSRYARRTRKTEDAKAKAQGNGTRNNDHKDNNGRRAKSPNGEGANVKHRKEGNVG